MDLACRSGERLTGESDRWPWPGPTVSSFLHASVRCPHLTPTNHLHPPATAPRLPAGSRGQKRWAQRAVLRLRPSRGGASVLGEHSALESTFWGSPTPAWPVLHPRVPPSSALCPLWGVWPSRLCEARSGPPSCPLAGLPSVLPSFLTVGPSAEAGLAALPGWGHVTGSSEP